MCVVRVFLSSLFMCVELLDTQLNIFFADFLLLPSFFLPLLLL